MDINQIEVRPTIQNIYSIVGQDRIMEFYLNYKIVLGKKYINPLRNDSTPGCFFKWSQQGFLYFVDYATEKVYYNAIDVAMLITGYTYPDILYKIEADFNLTNLNLSDRKRLIAETKQTVVPEMNPAVIKVKLAKFTNKDLDYWAQFGIAPTILKFYDIRKVEKAWINSDLWYVNNENDPCYRYKEKEKFKLYRPLVKKKNYKFRTNFFGGVLEGYTQLPSKGQLLIITKGLKDVMTLHALGYNAVAVRSENTPMSENAYELLKNRFEKMVLWFDPDAAGIGGAKKMSEKFNIPFFSYQGEFGKDPSDIYKEHGPKKVIELCKQLENL
jgi:hypothetical protein